MKDRMDHFKITPKKGSKDNYLKLSEDKFLDEVNAKMEELGRQVDKKIPKEGATPQDDLEFCEGITKDLVAWMNKKYGKFFSIKYKCYFKVRQNPPAPESQDLHLNDEFLKKCARRSQLRRLLLARVQGRRSAPRKLRLLASAILHRACPETPS